MEKRWWILIIMGIVLFAILLTLLYYYKDNSKIISKNDCDKSILSEEGKSYINEVRFEDDGIVLIGNYRPSTIYYENHSVASNEQVNPKIKLGQEFTIYLTEECTSRFKLINFSNEKAIFDHNEGCAPPGPSQKKECTFEIINSKSVCKSLDTLENSNETRDIISCYLNNQKSIFNPSEVLAGTCNVSRIKDQYVDNKYNQVVNAPCNDCHLQGAEVWFDCDGYSSQFGCFFTIYQNKSFGEIHCPVGV